MNAITRMCRSVFGLAGYYKRPLKFEAQLNSGYIRKAFCSTQSVLNYREESTLKDIESANILFPEENTKESSEVEVCWSNGEIYKFSSLHLRDSCRCTDCYDHSSLQRQLNLCHDVPLGIKPKEIWTANDRLEIKWEDSHTSSFDKERLIRMHTSPNKTNIYHDRSDTMFWNGEYKIFKYDYHEIMSDNCALIDFILKLKSHGLSLVLNVPCKEGQIREFADRFAKLRNTHYKEIFTVKSKKNPNNLAYTNKDLKLHVDLPYYSEIPSVQMLHCIKQAEKGGKNIFVDGLNCAVHLREADPEAFHTLTTYDWPFCDIAWEDGKMHYLQTRRPVIELNKYGKVDKIAYNNHVRDDIGANDPKMTLELYRSLNAFSKILHDPQFMVEYLVSEGELVIFDNGRVLHGRKAFETCPNSGERHYEGGYIEWDDILSTLRVNTLMKE